MGRKPFRIHDFEKKIGAYQQQGYFEVDVSVSQKKCPQDVLHPQPVTMICLPTTPTIIGSKMHHFCIKARIFFGSFLTTKVFWKHLLSGMTWRKMVR